MKAIALPSEFDCMCPKFFILFWFFICANNMSVYPCLIVEEIFMDLHYGWNKPNRINSTVTKMFLQNLRNSPRTINSKVVGSGV